MHHETDVIERMDGAGFVVLAFVPQPLFNLLAVNGGIFRDTVGRFADTGAVFKDDRHTVLIGDIGVLNTGKIAVSQIKRFISADESVAERLIAISCTFIKSKLIDHGSRAAEVHVFHTDNADTGCKRVILFAAAVRKPVLISLCIDIHAQTVLKGACRGCHGTAVLTDDLCTDRRSVMLGMNGMFRSRSPVLRPDTAAVVVQNVVDVVE